MALQRLAVPQVSVCAKSLVGAPALAGFSGLQQRLLKGGGKPENPVWWAQPLGGVHLPVAVALVVLRGTAGEEAGRSQLGFSGMPVRVALR